MKRTPILPACISIVALALLTQSTTAQPNPNPESDRNNTLKGPSVPAETQNSLGSTNMNGYFTPVEGRPELAAFALITTDPNHLAAARDLDSKRIFDLTIYLVDEIDTVREITDAITSGNAPQAQLLLAQMRLRFEPDLPRDPLAPELLEMLTDDQSAEFTRIINDYWLRWTQSQNDAMNPDPESDAYKKTENQLNNQLFQKDIKEAYDSSLKRYRDTTDAIYTAVSPTEDQQAQIRNLMIEHIKETRLKATIEQRQAVLLEIYLLLDEDRRELLFLFMTRAAINRTG